MIPLASLESSVRKGSPIDGWSTSLTIQDLTHPLPMWEMMLLDFGLWHIQPVSEQLTSNVGLFSSPVLQRQYTCGVSRANVLTSIYHCSKIWSSQEEKSSFTDLTEELSVLDSLMTDVGFQMKRRLQIICTKSAPNWSSTLPIPHTWVVCGTAWFFFL